ncbi:MAG: VWA domain-containing protein [Planctomycetota bacterium]|nr:VWA domain-containing protein [Planctomycetota bacterium]
MSCRPIHLFAVALILSGCFTVHAEEAEAQPGAPAKELASRVQGERGKLLAGSKVQVGALLTVQAPAAAEGQTAAVAMTLVIDRSGSMEDAGKMEMVHVAGPDLVDRLESTDQLGIVAYASDVQTVRPLAGLTDPAGIKALIRELGPTSGTNLGGGLKEGTGLFKPGKQDGMVRRVMLLSDGNANEGETDPEALARWAQEAFNAGIRVSTVGLGQDYNELLMTKLAHAGGGEFYYVKEKDQLPPLFHKELEEGRVVVARDLNLSVTFAAGVKLLEAVGYPFSGGDDRAREIKIGDLFSNEKRALLLRFEMAVPEGAADAWNAASLDLAWKSEKLEARAAHHELSFGVTAMESEVTGSVDGDVRVRILELERYKTLDKAMTLYREGKKDDAVNLLKQAEEEIGREAAASGDAKLLAQAGQLAQARREVESGENERDVQLFNTESGAFGVRRGGGMRRLSLRAGGSSATESAVDFGLRWFEKRQEADGSWDAALGGGRAEDRQRVTAWMSLAILGAGHTPKVGRHKEQVAKALAWLIARQREDGRVGEAAAPPGSGLGRFRAVYEHALAATALAEAAGMTRLDAYTAPAQQAVAWLAHARVFELLEKESPEAKDLAHDDLAGLGFCAMALRSAKAAGLNVPDEALASAARFFEAAKRKTPGGFGYAFFAPAEAGPRALDTAVGLCAAQMLGSARDDLEPGARWLLAQPGALPTFKDEARPFDWHYAYFANLALFQQGGEAWKTWNENLKQELLGGGDEGRGGPRLLDARRHAEGPRPRDVHGAGEPVPGSVLPVPAAVPLTGAGRDVPDRSGCAMLSAGRTRPGPETPEMPIRSLLALAVLGGSLAGWAGEAGPAAQVVPIAWANFKTDAPRNPDAQACARMLLNSVRCNLAWAEKIIPEIAARGHALSGQQAHDTIRPASSAACAIAVALKTGIYDPQAAGLSAEEATKRAAELIKVTAAAHRKKAHWNYAWQASFWAAQLGQAAWMLWDGLDAETRELAAETVVFQADRFIQDGYRVPYWNGKGGDSKAEENAWNSMILHLAVAMLPRHAHAARWREAGTRLMVSAYATQADDESNATVLDGRAVKDWLDGYNLRADGAVINHNRVHCDYMVCTTLNLRAFVIQPLAGQAASESADFNAELIYRTLVAARWDSPPHKPPGGTMYLPGKPEVYYPEGTDWSPFRFDIFYLADVYAHFLEWGRAEGWPAAEWMRLRAAKILEMQARHPDGRMFAKGEFDRFPGREQLAARQFADAWLCFWLHAQGKLGRKANWLAPAEGP